MQKSESRGRDSTPVVQNKLQKKSRSFCDEKSKNIKERTPVDRTLQVFELALDVEEKKAVNETRSSLDLTNYKEEEKKELDPNWGRKNSYPEIIVTRCEKQVETVPELDKPERPKKKFLFADFNEKCTERKKQIEQMKLHEQHLKEVSMDKYPFQWTKKQYTKSTFYVLNTPSTSDEGSMG